MKYLQRIIIVILLLILPALINAQKSVKLQGTWELVSQTENGKDHPIEGRHIKLLTKSHYSWARQDRKQVEELLAKGTQRDSIVAYHDAYATGTYKVVGDKYIETAEFFYAPQYIGKSVEFKFKLEGNRWYISGHFSHYDKDKKIDEVQLDQVWKRID
jgi:hypothetical protein